MNPAITFAIASALIIALGLLLVAAHDLLLSRALERSDTRTPTPGPAPHRAARYRVCWYRREGPR